jgi:5-methylcytosine-specific restriction enzyme B
MRHVHAKGLYDIFDNFIDTCIIKDNSLLTENEGVFTLNNVEECLRLFNDNPKTGKQIYEEKIKEQFNAASQEVKIVFAHANWLWAVAVDDMTSGGKKRAVKICLLDSTSLKDDKNLFPDGFGSAGLFHKQNKYLEVVCNLKLFKWLKKERTLSDIESVKSFIEQVCLYEKHEQDKKSLPDEIKKEFTNVKRTCAMYNILLHLCNPDSYERIASDNHKRSIVASFESLLDKNEDKNIDENIAEIRKKLKDSGTIKENFDFYDEEKILQIWNPWLTDSEFSEIQGLSFKRNIILYGAPGTGKTYTANALARSFIIQKLIAEDNKKVKEYFESKIDVDKRIKKLQLHSNYSYEDFIVGIRMKDGKTLPEKGYLLNLCEEISKDNDKTPYVLILDEINRIDLSRLFGEAFSGIEDRGNSINTSFPDVAISIPENLYIIGTMNEIDFSLERIDFALRRRFVWFQYGFNKMKLIGIINKKKNNLQIDDIDRFIESAELLNNEIKNLNELGKQYEIGHTFFSEIIDIAKLFTGRRFYKNNMKLYRESGPAQVLWNISIEPMIIAFLGNLDEETKDKKIKEMMGLFLNGKK